MRVSVGAIQTRRGVLEGKDSLARVLARCAGVVVVGKGIQDGLVLEGGFLAVIQPLPLCHVLVLLLVVLQTRVDGEVVGAGHLCLGRKSLVELLGSGRLSLGGGGCSENCRQGNRDGYRDRDGHRNRRGGLGHTRHGGVLRMHLESTGHAGHRGSARLGKLGSAGGAGDNTNRRWANGLDSRGRDSCCCCGCGVGSAGGLFPGPSPPGSWPSSDGIQGRVKSARALARHAIVGLVLSPTKALEVLTVAESQSGVPRELVGQGGEQCLGGPATTPGHETDDTPGTNDAGSQAGGQWVA